MPECLLENVVIRYAHLDRPWSGSPTIEADYNCQIIFPQNWPGWPALQEAVNAAIRDKFGAQPPGNMKLPWLNKYLQPNQQADGPYLGCYFMNVVGKGTKPLCFDQNVQPIPDLQLKEFIFSGCVINIQVSFAGYTQGPGVGTYFRNPTIQLVNNQVEAIPDASAKDPSEVFKTVPWAPAATAPPPGAVPGTVPGAGDPPW